MKQKKYNIFICLLYLIMVIFTGPASGQTETYDPLKISEKTSIKKIDLLVKDRKRQRIIPILIYLAVTNNSPLPVVLFSHGLGGSRHGCTYLGEHWSARGYAAVFIQHPGSDTSVWKELPVKNRMKAMKEAANAKNFLLRVKDIPAVLNQLEQWNVTEAHPLHQRLELRKIGVSGHSFGAVTTQAVSGQSFRGRQLFTDPRIKAAIAFSPSSPRRGNDPDQAFGKVKIPWLLMTGTEDVALIGDADLKSRLSVFPALPSGNKYELVLYRAEHSAFTDRTLPGDKKERNPNHHRAILAISTAFWDTCLKADIRAKTWLCSDKVRLILEKKDRWQIK